jgi:hypothetical protein
LRHRVDLSVLKELAASRAKSEGACANGAST